MISLAGLKSRLFPQPLLRQGPHIDPDSPEAPEPPERFLTMMGTPAMRAFQGALVPPGERDMRAGVLGELSDYWKRDARETLNRCLHWEDYSLDEWQRAPRDDQSGLFDFYQQCESWTYDLLWYDYVRACGQGLASSVLAAEWLTSHVRPGRALDFGSGAGTTSLMFDQLGWRTAMADVSMPLLDFARWRAQRRDVSADYFDAREPLPAGEFDVITAIDTFILVPDPGETAENLHRALRPGGYLFADFDVREPSAFNAWHLYSEARGLRWTLWEAGFTQVGFVGTGWTRVYRRDNSESSAHRRAKALAWTRVGPPAQRAERSVHQARRAVRNFRSF